MLKPYSKIINYAINLKKSDIIYFNEYFIKPTTQKFKKVKRPKNKFDSKEKAAPKIKPAPKEKPAPKVKPAPKESAAKNAAPLKPANDPE